MGNVAKAATKLAGSVLGSVAGFAIGGPAGAAAGFMMGSGMDQQRKQNKVMKAYHQNAERMYNEQSNAARSAQARIDSERNMLTQRHKSGIARTNRSRMSGGVFRDEYDLNAR